MSADVQSSPKVVDHKSPVVGVQSVSKAPPGMPQQSHHRRSTPGRIQQQQQQRRSNGANTVSCGNLGQKDNKKPGGGGGGGGAGFHHNNNNYNSRKRSQSFSGGGAGGGVSVGVANAGGGGGGGGVGGVGGGGGKMFPAYKRRKKDHIIPPTKFLLGGNICDPLNLNSLLDEDINRAMNAVTPKSSPLPTPKHRKGHVEVIIPPNINDPLNLLQMSADGDCQDDYDDYEKSLISPVKGGGGGGGVGGGGGKRNKRKRRHTKSFSSQSKEDSGNDETGLGVAAVASGGGAVEARLHEAAAARTEEGSDSTNDITAMEPASLTRRKAAAVAARANLKLDLQISRGDEIKMAVDEVASPDREKLGGCAGDVGSTHSPHTPTNPTTSAFVQLTTTPETVTSSTASTTPTVTSSSTLAASAVTTTKSSLVTSSSLGGVGVTKPAMTSSSGGGGGGIFKKCRKDSKDKIVSPAIPQPGAWGDRGHHHHHHHHHHHRFKPHPHQLTPHIDKNQKTPNFKEVNTRFRYGNYNRYYGYRNIHTPHNHHQNQNHQHQHLDPRLRVLLRRRDLFDSRDVLDIGCNVGHVTLAVARDTNPRSIVGIDIDRQLVEAAKRNVKHYVNSGAGLVAGSGRVDGGKWLPYPRAMPAIYGPLDAPRQQSGQHRFPYNVSFVQGNYVLDSDALLSLDERCQFDTILCLSVTKWFHLNWGDAGLKRAFRRMYAQLRPGGRLILEPQPWHSYKKKRNLTPEIWNNYKSIELFPHKFSQYLLSEVGFTKCEVVGTPHHHSKGFQRPIKLFTKGELSSAPCSVRTTNVEAEEEGVVTSLNSATVTSSDVVEGAVKALGEMEGVVTSLDEQEAVVTPLDVEKGVVTSLNNATLTSLDVVEGLAVTSLGEMEGVVTSLDEQEAVVTSLKGAKSIGESVMTSSGRGEDSVEEATMSLDVQDGVVTSLKGAENIGESVMTSLGEPEEGVVTSFVEDGTGESVMTSLCKASSDDGVVTSLKKDRESMMTSLECVDGAEVKSSSE